MDTIDGLPPETRFLVRCVFAGRTLAEAAALLGATEDDAGKRLRAAAASAAITVPPMSAGSAALLDALEPLISAAGTPPRRTPATPCLTPSVSQAFAGGRLTGPLLLGAAEHVADCPDCLRRVLAESGPAGDDSGVPPPRRARASAAALLVVVVIVVVLLLAGLLA